MLHRFALLYIRLAGFLVGLEGALFLDCVKGCTHVHEKSLEHSSVPDGDAKLHIFPDGSLAISLLLNLGAARQGRSVLFSGEQKLLFKGWKKGSVMSTKLDFMRH